MKHKIKTLLSLYARDEEGATAIEYGLIAALIGVGIIAGARALTGVINGMFSDVDSELVTAFEK